MEKIQIFVVIQYYNMANYVSRAIKSVLDQTSPHFEIWGQVETALCYALKKLAGSPAGLKA